MDELVDASPAAVIDVASNGTNWRIAGKIMQSGIKQMILRTGQDVPARASVKVQGADDLIYLGEVLNSLQRGASEWDIEVTVKRRLMVL